MINAGVTASVPLTLDGVVATITLSAPTGITSGTSSTGTVTANGADAAGVPIIGTFANPITLTASNGITFASSVSAPGTVNFSYNGTPISTSTISVAADASGAVSASVLIPVNSSSMGSSYSVSQSNTVSDAGYIKSDTVIPGLGLALPSSSRDTLYTVTLAGAYTPGSGQQIKVNLYLDGALVRESVTPTVLPAGTLNQVETVIVRGDGQPHEVEYRYQDAWNDNVVVFGSGTLTAVSSSVIQNGGNQGNTLADAGNVGADTVIPGLGLTLTPATRDTLYTVTLAGSYTPGSNQQIEVNLYLDGALVSESATPTVLQGGLLNQVEAVLVRGDGQPHEVEYRYQDVGNYDVVVFNPRTLTAVASPVIQDGGNQGNTVADGGHVSVDTVIPGLGLTLSPSTSPTLYTVTVAGSYVSTPSNASIQVELYLDGSLVKESATPMVLPSGPFSHTETVLVPGDGQPHEVEYRYQDIGNYGVITFSPRTLTSVASSVAQNGGNQGNTIADGGHVGSDTVIPGLGLTLSPSTSDRLYTVTVAGNYSAASSEQIKVRLYRDGNLESATSTVLSPGTFTHSETVLVPGDGQPHGVEYRYQDNESYGFVIFNQRTLTAIF